MSFVSKTVMPCCLRYCSLVAACTAPVPLMHHRLRKHLKHKAYRVSTGHSAGPLCVTALAQVHLHALNNETHLCWCAQVGAGGAAARLGKPHVPQTGSQVRQHLCCTCLLLLLLYSLHLHMDLAVLLQYSAPWGPLNRMHLLLQHSCKLT